MRHDMGTLPRGVRPEARNLAGTTTLVTGGSSGIGLELAKHLATAGSRLILPIRNPTKGAAAQRTVCEAAPGADVDLMDLDLADLASVHRLADTLLSRGQSLDTVVLNAGIMDLGRTRWAGTHDGFETHFQTNFLSHAVLLIRLLPLLIESKTRVVVQTSLDAAHAHIHWDDLQTRHPYGPFRAYGASKLALSLLGQELAGRSAVNGWGVSVVQAHPGVVPGTSIAGPIRAMFPSPLVHWAERRVGNPPRVAALPALAACAAQMPDVGSPLMFAPSRLGGVYGDPKARLPFASTLDPFEAKKVWEMAVRQAERRA